MSRQTIVAYLRQYLKNHWKKEIMVRVEINFKDHLTPLNDYCYCNAFALELDNSISISSIMLSIPS